MSPEKKWNRFNTFWWYVTDAFKRFRNKDIIDHTFNVFGYELHFRFLPDGFKRIEREICKLVDSNDYEAAKILLTFAYDKYGQDPDLIRIDSFNECNMFSSKETGIW